MDNSGGAAIAAMRLHRAMLENNIDSSFICLNRTLDKNEHIYTLDKKTRIKSKIVDRIKNHYFRKIYLSNKKGLFSNMTFGYKLNKFIKLKEYDIIYIHWCNNSFLSLKGLKEICKTGKQIYWFMHDMFPITGGCHHSFECNGYQKKCGNCPYMKTPSKDDFSSKQLRLKHKILDKYQNVSFISPSKWLYNCAIRSSLAKNHNVYRIPNIVNPNIFKKADKNICQKLLGLDENKKYISFGADGALTNPYKGYEYLERSLSIIRKKITDFEADNIELLIFGSTSNSSIEHNIPFKTHFFGYLHDVYSLNLLYNSTNVFCIPSLAENFCQTALESVFCGTPVVAFDVGGLPDIVSEKTGYLAKYKNIEDFAKGIELCLNRNKIDNFEIINNCNPDGVLKKHIELWNKQ